MFDLTTHSTHFFYGYMTLDILYRTIQIARKETHCHHMCYTFRLASGRASTHGVSMVWCIYKITLAANWKYNAM